MNRKKQRTAVRARPAAKPAAKRLVAFCCENSAAKAAASAAGDPVLEGVEWIRVPCAGRVEIRQILKRIEAGADVLVLACPLDNCQYIHGNRRTLKRVEKVKQVLTEAGIDEGRVRMRFLSSVDPHKLVNIIKEAKRP